MQSSQDAEMFWESCLALAFLSRKFALLYNLLTRILYNPRVLKPMLSLQSFSTPLTLGNRNIFTDWLSSLKLEMM